MNYYPSKIFANLLKETLNRPAKYKFEKIHKNISGIIYCAFLIEGHINEVGYEYLKITELIGKEMKWSTLKKWQEYPKMEGIGCKKWCFTKTSKLYKNIQEILHLRNSLAHVKPDEFQKDPVKLMEEKYKLKNEVAALEQLFNKFYKETGLTPPDQLSQIISSTLYKNS